MDIYPAFEQLEFQADSKPAAVLSTRVHCPIVVRQLLNFLETCNSPFFCLDFSDPFTQKRTCCVGYDPLYAIDYVNGVLRLNEKSIVTDNPMPALNELLNQYSYASRKDLPPFAGGLAGLFAFASYRFAEPVLASLEATEQPDLALLMADKLFVFNPKASNEVQLLQLILKADGQAGYEAGCQSLAAMADLLQQAAAYEKKPTGYLTSPFAAECSQAEYEAKVKQVKDYIQQGEVFQLVLANPQHASYTGSLLPFYYRLCELNPSPYQFFFRFKDLQVSGASPETLGACQQEQILTCPLAGTRPRPANPLQETIVIADLLADPKELAEHDMLVDLGRNDLNRLCQAGSVEVARLHEIRRFSHVLHIDSEIRGTLQLNTTVFDVLAGLLPAGTLSGAPKIRACQLISQLENSSRGFYGGAAGYLAGSGAMDLAIAIRFAALQKGQLDVVSGAGIVADSKPAKEYFECLHKTAALKQAAGGVPCMY